MEASEGGMARMYPSKKGTLVKHIRYGLCYIGGNLKERFSLHSLKDGKRLTQSAEREDFKILTRISWRTQFLPPN